MRRFAFNTVRCFGSTVSTPKAFGSSSSSSGGSTATTARSFGKKRGTMPAGPMTEKDARAALDMMRKNGKAPTTFEYNKLLEAMAQQNWRNPPVPEMENVMKEMEQSGVAADQYSYAAMIKALGASPARMTRIRQLLDQARNNGVAVTGRMSTQVLRAFSQEQPVHVEEAMDYFLEQSDKSIYDYGYLVRCIEQVKSVEERKAQLLKVASWVKNDPSTPVFTTPFSQRAFIRAFLSVNDTARALKVLKKTEHPTTEAMIDIISNWTGDVNGEGLAELVMSLSSSQLQDPLVLTAIIQAYSRSQTVSRAEEAINFFTKLQSLKIAGHPNKNAYTGILRALASANPERVSSAVSILDEMEANNVKAGAFPYFFVLKACASSGSGYPEKAQEIFDRLVETGHAVNGFSVGQLLKAYSKSNILPDDFHNLHMSLEGQYGAHSMISHVALAFYANQTPPLVSRVNETWERMLSSGITPLSFHCGSRLRCAVAFAAETGAQPIHDILADMDARQIEPDAYILNLALKGILAARADPTAIRQRMREAGVEEKLTQEQ